MKLPPRSRARTHSPNFDFLPSPFTAHPQRTRFQPFSGEGRGSSNLHRTLANGRTRCEGKRAKAFTLFSLSLNNLEHTGEGVKAKNKNCLTRAYTRARGSLLRRPRGLMPPSLSWLGRTRGGMGYPCDDGQIQTDDLFVRLLCSGLKQYT